MDQRNGLTRREFVKKSTVAGITANLGLSKSRILGANDRVRIAVVGIHGMGQSHIQSYQRLRDVEVGALCDVDESLFAERIQKHFVEKNLRRPETYVDIRKLLENREIDAVSIVTPNHWHTLAAIWAMQAGKHVSVEKPSSHNFYEGQKLLEASLKYPVIVQDGAEQRSNPCALSAARFLEDGGLGEVYLSKGICYKRRDTIGKTPDEPVPPGVHYDLWLGPAPSRPYSRNRFHYNWHWNWDYGNGDMGNQGVHEMDIARWMLGVQLPTRVSAVGGHFMFDDDQNTPNVLMVLFEFNSRLGGGDKKKILQFEVRHWFTNGEDPVLTASDSKAPAGYMIDRSNVVGNLVYGSEGYMAKTVTRWQSYMGKALEPGPSGGGEADHYQAFVDAIRTGDPKTFNRRMEEAFYSCALVHLGNISYRLGRSLDFDPTEQRFVGDEEANRMLRRKYREPFVVPDNV